MQIVSLGTLGFLLLLWTNLENILWFLIFAVQDLPQKKPRKLDGAKFFLFYGRNQTIKVQIQLHGRAG